MGACEDSPARMDFRMPRRCAACLRMSVSVSPWTTCAAGAGRLASACRFISSIWAFCAERASFRCCSMMAICCCWAACCWAACWAACCWAACCDAACCDAACCICPCCCCAACFSCLLGPLRPPPPNHARQGERMGFSWWSVSRIAYGVFGFRKLGAGGLADSMRCREVYTEQSCKGYFD